MADAVFFLVALIEATANLYWAEPWQSVLAFTAAGGLLVRRRWPWVSFLSSAPALSQGLLLLTPILATFSLAVKERRRLPVAAAGCAMFVLVAQPWWGFSAGPVMTALSLSYAGLYAVAPIALGLLVRARKDLAERLTEVLALRHREEQLLRAEVLATERARLSREMHDVVSHQRSLIAVQAGAWQVSGGDDASKETARTIRAIAVATLIELRQMIAVLRLSDDDQAPGMTDPQHAQSVAEIGPLVAISAPRASLSLRLPPLPDAHERTLYRAVQEGLTNVRKHASGASVSVKAWATSRTVELRVTNSLALTTSERLPSSGLGLVGIRERAQLLGGDLEVRQTSDSFILAVTLPRPPSNEM